MNETIKGCLLDNLWFKILSFSAVILLFISLILPPTGVIDPSVIAATGELAGFGAIWTVLVALNKGKGISVSHGDTTITVNGRKYVLEKEEKTEEE